MAGRLNEVRSGYKDLREISVEKKKGLLRALTEREAIAEHMENVETWLREKENAYKALGKLPLSLTDLLRHLEEKKVWRYFFWFYFWICLSNMLNCEQPHIYFPVELYNVT